MFRNLSGIVFLAAAATLLAQDPAPAPTDTPAPPAAAAAPNPPGLRAPSSDPQPYDKVITKDVKSATGIFIVHQVKDRFYCEIPKGELDKEFLLKRARFKDHRWGWLRRRSDVRSCSPLGTQRQ